MSDPTDMALDGPLLIDTINPPAVEGRPMDHRKQPKKKDRGPIPARQGNGYYADHTTGDRLRSVTTILGGGVPKPALIHWAGNMVADSAIENLPALVAASRNPEQLAELRRWITRAHTRKKDERAEVGGLVHKVIESRLLGTPLPRVIRVGETEWAINGPELAPFLEHFLRFEDEWQPRWTASEMVVANPEHGWAGTLDYLIGADGRIGDALRAAGWDVDPAGDLMGDTKTGGDWIVPADGSAPHPKILGSGHVHGVYPEAGLQMSAYRQGKVCWLRDGSKAPMPATAEVGVVLHLRPEGYRLYPARCGELEYRYFRHAQMVDEWSSRIASAKADEPVIGKALVPPAPPAEAVA
ncbi:hypothetical protein [Pimelobacter simplex]|uniref:hypothetical protein n=1 Tax=Nocardioides simplex TaxID=2045 RepID=UPI00214FE5D3|nr:hypothetical protein [Pimelobacter simplex]UUW88433.1 hypothetical protein M0M43_22200 [Pimelobacter simplex]UUW97937.1 hypothetical protein M0M48_10845 [Pimelobacter simplex]